MKKEEPKLPYIIRASFPKGLPTVQRFVISKFPLIPNDELYRFLRMELHGDYRCEISEEDEEEFYKYLSKFRGIM